CLECFVCQHHDTTSSSPHLAIGDEPLSPQSDARAKGLHYTVKERRYGYECLICGLLGDIRWIRSSPCKPKDAPDPEASLDKTAMEAKARQEQYDLEMARELYRLQVEEKELEQMLVLQQLENEEQLLQGLLNEKRALEIAELAAAKALKPKPASKPTDVPKDGDFGYDNMETQVIPSGSMEELPHSISGACQQAEESVAPEGEVDSAVELKTSDGDAAPMGPGVDVATEPKTSNGDAAPEGDVDSAATEHKTSDGDAAPKGDVDSATGPKTSNGDAAPVLPACPVPTQTSLSPKQQVKLTNAAPSKRVSKKQPQPHNSDDDAGDEADDNDGDDEEEGDSEADSSGGSKTRARAAKAGRGRGKAGRGRGRSTTNRGRGASTKGRGRGGRGGSTKGRGRGNGSCKDTEVVEARASSTKRAKSDPDAEPRSRKKSKDSKNTEPAEESTAGKPKSKAKAKAAPKKAAAPEPSKPKRAQTPNGDDDDEERRKKSRKSCAYHKAKADAIKAGLPADVAKQAAQHAYKETD
ncbi:unnamed protein product, partial [Symbiodinium necroappetens]